MPHVDPDAIAFEKPTSTLHLGNQANAPFPLYDLVLSDGINPGPTVPGAISAMQASGHNSSSEIRDDARLSSARELRRGRGDPAAVDRRTRGARRRSSAALSGLRSQESHRYNRSGQSPRGSKLNGRESSDYCCDRAWSLASFSFWILRPISTNRRSRRTAVPLSGRGRDFGSISANRVSTVSCSLCMYEPPNQAKLIKTASM